MESETSCSRLFDRLEDRTLLSAVLRVGSGEMYAMPSQAIAAAHDGDTILIDTNGNYYNDVAAINKNNLTIRGVGPGRALIRTDGRVFGEKGIWDFRAGFSNLTVQNIDFEGARVANAYGANGAGIRSEGTNLTVLNCRFYNNQNGILGGYGTTTIEYSEFASNGLTGYTHNVYIADGTLLFEYNWSHDSQVGHLLKSRAKLNLILYNRLSDESGAGSYELDLPNGGKSMVAGNVIEQSATSQNGTILAYGEEGIVPAGSELDVVNNTFVNNRSSGIFISASNLPAGFKLLVKNNLFAGPGTPVVASGALPVVAGNVYTTVAGANFVNAAGYDYHLRAGSPAINAGVNPGTGINGWGLTPIYEYVHPTSRRLRPVNGKLDAGAFEFV